jgi:GMP synthase (glutamine-hydrolysing)
MIAILKLGRTYDSLAAKRGDFEHWILAGLGVSSDSFYIVDLTRGGTLPLYRRLTGVIMTGSHAMVTDDHEWVEPLVQWIPGIIARQIPLLGICFGHQLLAHALGGQVGYNPGGMELGTVSVTLHNSARKDRLLGGLGNPIRVHCCHAQSVLRLPKGAVCLGASERDPHQAFSVGHSVWGVQFHPEFDAEITCAYVDQLREDLTRQGQDPDRIMADCRDTPYGPLILRRFAGIVRNRAMSCEL